MAKKQSLKQKRKIRSARPRQQLPVLFDPSEKFTIDISPFFEKCGITQEVIDAERAKGGFVERWRTSVSKLPEKMQRMHRECPFSDEDISDTQISILLSLEVLGNFA